MLTPSIMKRIIALNLLFLCSLFGLFVFRYSRRELQENLQIIHCSVGQGDAILLKKGSFELLIDAGPDDSILKCLRESGVPEGDTLEVLLATHGDSDHIGGMRSVLNRYPVGLFLWNGWMKQTAVFQGISTLLEEKGIPHLEVKAGDRFQYNAVAFLVLWPDCHHPFLKGCRNTERQDANAGSVALQAKFGDFSALFFGDLPGEIENSLALSGAVSRSLWLKVSHHGSASSTFPEMVQVVRPLWCSIGVGKNNYGHPNPEVLQRLKEVGCRVLRTDLEGTIRAETDGHRVWLSTP